jgi:hypothetical protein
VNWCLLAILILKVWILEQNCRHTCRTVLLINGMRKFSLEYYKSAKEIVPLIRRIIFFVLGYRNLWKMNNYVVCFDFSCSKFLFSKWSFKFPAKIRKPSNYTWRLRYFFPGHYLRSKNDLSLLGFATYVRT